MLGVCAVGLKDRRVGGGSRRSSAINDDVPPSVVDRGWEFYMAPSKCQRRLSLAGARCPSCADLVSGALRLLGDTLLTRRMRKPFAVGMKGGLGLGRLCSQRSGIPHLLARIYGWVLQGLAWWRRPLPKSHCGDREFLITLGCEGGVTLERSPRSLACAATNNGGDRCHSTPHAVAGDG
jgi:hypothetical protein